MFKKISLLVVLFLTTLFLIQPASKPAHAATLTWEPMVNDTFTGTRAAGFGDEHNAFASSMITFDGYVYVANLNDTTGTEIWRSSNGTDWEQVNEDGFSDPGIMLGLGSFATLAVFDNHLYAFDYLAGEDHVNVYRYSSGTTWTNTTAIGDVDTHITQPISAIVYDNTLYVSLINTTGVSDKSTIYKSTNGDDWTMVNDDGFGGNNEDIQSMAVYNNCLYAGTYNINDGTEVWRFDGTTWVQDNTSGFGNVKNDNTGTLTSFGGYLYASIDNSTTGAEVWKTSGGGTNDWTKVSDAGLGQGTDVLYTYSSVVFKNKLYIGAGAGAFNPVKVLRSADGTTWEQVNTNGFGYDDNIMAIFTVLGDYLYAGTGSLPDYLGGFAMTTEIYRYYEPMAVVTTLPETGFDSPLNAYILDALL